jgi:hypothetical protein
MLRPLLNPTRRRTEFSLANLDKPWALVEL